MTVEDLRELAEKEQARQAEYEHRILYCSSAGCVSSGCDAVKNELKKAIGELDLSKKCEMIGTGCLGLCGEGPLVFVSSGPTCSSSTQNCRRAHWAGQEGERERDRLERSLLRVAKENRT